MLSELEWEFWKVRRLSFDLFNPIFILKILFTNNFISHKLFSNFLTFFRKMRSTRSEDLFPSQMAFNEPFWIIKRKILGRFQQSFPNRYRIVMRWKIHWAKRLLIYFFNIFRMSAVAHEYKPSTSSLNQTELLASVIDNHETNWHWR